MRINHNIAALNTYRQLSQNQNNVSKSLERLSSGLRINRASDDAAGLAVSEKMRSQIRGLDMASRNAMDGISLIQTAEGALDTVHSMLQRIRELTVQAANGTNTTEDRTSIQNEVNALTSEISRISNTMEFNTKKLLDGSASVTAVTNVGNLTGGQDADGSTTPATPEIEASRTIDFITTPRQGDILTIDGKTIGFWDSSSSKYPDAATAKAALGVTKLIDIHNGNIYKTPPTIADELIADTTLQTDVVFSKSDAGDNFTVTAKPAPGTKPGAAGNNIAITYLPSTDNGLKVQIGANTGQQLLIDIPDTRSQSINITGVKPGGNLYSQDGKTSVRMTATKVISDGVNSGPTECAIDVTDPDNAAKAITIIDEAISKISQSRARLGAYQNRLEYTNQNLSVSSENLTAAESRIRDADMALEMTNSTKNNIINQAATAMLAQANQLPQGILQLLQ